MDKMQSQSTKWLVRNRDLRVVCSILCVAFLVALPRGGAQSRGTRDELQREIKQRTTDESAGRESEEVERRLRMLNADRQKTMVSDADKLLKLAAQLNAEISAANQGELTPAQLKKISEIEKLARKVREKMSTSVRGTAMNPGTYIQDVR